MTVYTPGVVVAFDGVDLTDPNAAFAFGVAYGMALEREAADPANDQIHRGAVADVRAVIQRADARAEADLPGARPGDWEGR